VTPKKLQHHLAWVTEISKLLPSQSIHLFKLKNLSWEGEFPGVWKLRRVVWYGP
jgi:hypothetical protein